MTTLDVTVKTTTKCGHLEFLAEKGFIHFGTLLNLEKNTSRYAPILSQLKEGRDGMLRRTRDCTWIELRYCPLCGEKTEANERK